MMAASFFLFYLPRVMYMFCELYVTLVIWVSDAKWDKVPVLSGFIKCACELHDMCSTCDVLYALCGLSYGSRALDASRGYGFHVVATRGYRTVAVKVKFSLLSHHLTVFIP